MPRRVIGEEGHTPAEERETRGGREKLGTQRSWDREFRVEQKVPVYGWKISSTTCAAMEC